MAFLYLKGTAKTNGIRKLQFPFAPCYKSLALLGEAPVAAYPDKTRKPKLNTLVICSGGLDSVTLAHKIASEHRLLGLVSFDYGQRHRKELDFAALCASRLDAPHTVIDISQIGAQLAGSALTDNIDVPDGHYAEESMKITVVPNRNAIMLSIAYGIASSRKAGAVAAAFHGGDHYIYPDCRPPFVAAFEKMQKLAIEGEPGIELFTPFLSLTKAGIVSEGSKLGVPFAQTWSCYKGGDAHCGRCGTCVERREAFHLAGVADPTPYADPDYWIGALAKKERAA